MSTMMRSGADRTEGGKASWSVGWACPNCPASREAREQVCTEDFGVYLLVMLLPFLVILLASYLVDREPRSAPIRGSERVRR